MTIITFYCEHSLAYVNRVRTILFIINRITHNHTHKACSNNPQQEEHISLKMITAQEEKY